jgi:1-deoxy-D-xylulose-5-phosphate reductoisomerase
VKRIAILGSTGSIGVQALDVVARFPDRFQVVGLAAGRNAARLVEQVQRFRPRVVSVADEGAARELREVAPRGTEVLAGDAGAVAVASHPEVDFVLAAISGGAGLRSTAAAIEAGKPVGLANKESLVLAGELLTARAAARGVPILPVDSEHSAIYQSLVGHNRHEVRRLILTASGGPLRLVPAEELASVGPERALKHPNWSMGAKITIDSATLMNKGLEVIEARWLFGVEPRRIDIVVHPESIVHSMVEYIDGSMVAQLGVSDMRGPISYAMWHPERLPLDLPPLDLARLGKLTFEQPDPARFPAFMLAYRALELGGTAPAVLSGADEAAVAAFLARRCRFPDIAEICATVLEAHVVEPVRSVEQALAASEWGRREAERRVARSES